MNSEAAKELSSIFKDKVCFNKTERKLYSHDIASVPAIVKPFIGKTLASAVVQPKSEDELVAVVKWSAKYKIPLIPRGKATSGYGGVLPLNRGVVVDFHWMSSLIDINEDDMSATVMPGIIWAELDKKLKKKNLTLRLYPSSYPGSTAGGWLANGGTGFGAYEAGIFKDNVISARVVLPDGSVKEFFGDELDLISDAEGITGFISQIKLKVMKLEEMEIASVAVTDEEKLQLFFEQSVAKSLPLWSVIYINPEMAAMKNLAPLQSHFGHETEKRTILPKSYIITLTYRKKDAKNVNDKLQEIISLTSGQMLDQSIAKHEWENRFKIMVVKRLGPSLVPAEFIVPLSSLAKVTKEMQKAIKHPVVKEGVLIKNGPGGEPEVVVLGFIPSDERKFSYNFVFVLSLTIMKIASKYGGRPFASGIYFANQAKAILGVKRYDKIKEFKSKTDINNLFNPGKVYGLKKLNIVMRLAGLAEPFIRPFSNRIVSRIGERPPLKPVKSIPADVAWYAYACSQCGYCVPECDQFYGRGWESQSPRGRWYWLREFMEGREKWSQYMVDSFLACTTCEICNLKCSANLPIEQSWMKMRGELINEEKKMTIPPFEMMSAALQSQGDIWAGYRKDRDKWFPEELKSKYGPEKKAKIAYFAGCTASYVEEDIAQATVRLLDSAGVDFTYVGKNENCCGTPMLVAGKWDVFAETMKKNIQAVLDKGADTVVTSCPACDMMWRHTYPQWAEKLGIEYNIKALHYSELLAEKIKSGEFKFPENKGFSAKVTWHDSCHIGRVSGVYDAPREIINALPGVEFVEMENNREGAHCCGSVLTLIKEPEVAAEVGKIRLDEAVEAGAEKVLALCPCCEFQFRVTKDKKNVPVEIVDLARFASSFLGYEYPEPNIEVQRQWAVFEAMIALMSPAGFAKLMDTMWPELIDSMPLKMGKMMRFMGKIPGMLKIIKPLFPVLFPVMLPRMMPKVMDVMLERIGQKIPMPDYMKEQMPALMPKVMDNLMPHMVKDLVPLVSQPMIDYLQAKKTVA
ncbi:MAG: FAD-binding oxidoreductase [Actinobacteria bacterium]|nr:FAD-binding oxidoreductase [Actinomycetota bacterium]